MDTHKKIKFKIYTPGFSDDWKIFDNLLKNEMKSWAIDYEYKFQPSYLSTISGGTHIITSSENNSITFIQERLRAILEKEPWSSLYSVNIV